VSESPTLRARLVRSAWGTLPIPETAREAAHLCRVARDLPIVETVLRDDPTGRAVLAHFKTSPPRFRALVWGRACLQVPCEPQAYGTGRQFRALRTNCARAREMGYDPVRLDPHSYRLARHACYQSSSVRQGRPVEFEVWPFAGEPDEGRMFLAGCRDRHGAIVAVGRILVSGQFAWMRNLIGHADHVDSGVMYLLMRFCIEELSSRPEPDRPRWLLFDGYFDISPGMRYFQERVGAKPRNIRLSIDPSGRRRSVTRRIGRAAVSSRTRRAPTGPASFGAAR
jgi:hypothetical protein